MTDTSNMSDTSNEPLEYGNNFMLAKRPELLTRNSRDLDSSNIKAEERACRRTSDRKKIQRLGRTKSAKRAEIEAVEPFPAT